MTRRHSDAATGTEEQWAGAGKRKGAFGATIFDGSRAFGGTAGLAQAKHVLDTVRNISGPLAFIKCDARGAQGVII